MMRRNRMKKKEVEVIGARERAGRGRRVRERSKEEGRMRRSRRRKKGTRRRGRK